MISNDSTSAVNLTMTPNWKASFFLFLVIIEEFESPQNNVELMPKPLQHLGGHQSSCPIQALQMT